MFSRFTATIIPVGNVALYTLPNPPLPMQYISLKFSVAFTISANVNLTSLSHITVSDFPVVVIRLLSSSISFDLLRMIIQKMAIVVAIKTKVAVGTRTAIISLLYPDFPCALLPLQGGNPFSDPHRSAFPLNDPAGACLNTPTFGIGPDNWLYERSIDSKLIMEVDSPGGIRPEKLFCERLKFWSD